MHIDVIRMINYCIQYIATTLSIFSCLQIIFFFIFYRKFTMRFSQNIISKSIAIF